MYGQIPNSVEIIRMLVWSLGIFILGTIIFEKNKNNVMQKM